jgi:mannitol-specific phosphotransferase system IIBC component
MKRYIRCLTVGSIMAGLLALSAPRPVQAGPPKLEFSNTTVLVASGVVVVALVTIGILTYDKNKEEKKVAAKRAKKGMPAEYKPKTKEEMKEELEKMRQEGQ